MGAPASGAPAAVEHRDGPGTYDVAAVRAEFPILAQQVHGRPLVYLDNAATTQKPRAVLDAVRAYYERENSNVHRGVHWLSETATKSFEGARGKVRRFVGAKEDAELVFTRGATEAINLVASAWGSANLRKGDEVLVTGMEHHSNIVPWQLACQRTGATLRHVPIRESGELDLDAYARLLGPRTRMVAFTHMSNALGTVNPVREMARQAHDAGATVLVDGAQAVPHQPVDVRALGVDFYAASGHKMYGPTGIGFLYGRRDLLEAMPPYQGGGDMIRSVSFEGSTWNELPWKFEAGTPDIAGAIGLGAAVDFLEGLGMPNVAAHEAALVRQAVDALQAIAGVRLIGQATSRAGLVSFAVEGVHPHDIGSLLDRDGIAIRTGHHCAQPVMDFFGVPATNRASFGCYNTAAEVDFFAERLQAVVKLFG